MYWNWSKTIGAVFRIGIMLLSFSLVYQNLLLLNTEFLPQLPIGFILLIILGILILRHIYRTLKWYSIWLRKGREFENVIIHFCLYLIVFSVVFSIPLQIDKINFDNPTSKAETPKNDANNFITGQVESIKNYLSNATPATFTSPQIDAKWVHNFISIVNTERTKKGLVRLKESNSLDNIANARFKKMMEQPFISHYGVSEYNMGELVFYPDGFTEQAYVNNIKSTAYLHWEGLMNPTVSTYGYYIGEGDTLGVYQPCSVTEIPGANINEKEFFSSHGCTTTVEKSTWLVIDMT